MDIMTDRTSPPAAPISEPSATRRRFPYGQGLGGLLAPRTLAVIGASTRAETLGGKVMANLTTAGFTGTLYPVNPKADRILGYPAYPSIGAVPGPVDLALVVVPRDFVIGVVEECGRAGVGAVIVISAGFSETGPEGARLEEELKETAARAGLRMLGPNCMGAFNTDPAVSMDATFSPTPPIEGGVGLVSQSGALGVVILNMATGWNLGFSNFLSIGNGADVGVVDGLVFWEQDAHTRVGAMYLEALDEPRAFLEHARRLSAAKPLVAVKSGRSEAGARAASSHTGALATSDRVVDAVLRQAGVLRAPTIQDMCRWATALEKCPRPAGRRVGIVTNAGGPGILAADACSTAGLELPPLGETTRQALREFLPPEAAVGNPVDMIASATAEHYRRAVELVEADPGIDMVMVLVVQPVLYPPLEVVRALASYGVNRRKPCVSAFMTEHSFYPVGSAVPGAPPIYRYPEPAAWSLRALVDHAEGQARPRTPFPPFTVDTAAAHRALAPAAQAAQRSGGAVLLPHQEATAVLEAYGLRLPGQRIVSDAAGAAQAAGQLGGAVALKTLAADLLHKSDVGGVALHLEGAEAVGARADRMQRELAGQGISLEGFLVQAMAPPGIELIASARRDPVAGPLLMVGAGGLFAEAYQDVALRLLPVIPADVEEMLRSLQVYELLAGRVRGKGVHLPTVVEVLGRVGRLLEDLPGLSEVELNPVVFTSEPGVATVVDAVLRAGSL
jgi:acetyl coenzyme A synthetase (ADP forming)-like protein